MFTLLLYDAQISPLLKEARGVRDECLRHGRDAIERPEGRPSFHSLFRDVHSFAKGVANTSRVTELARSLARFAGIIDDETAEEKSHDLVERARLLREETVWQGAAGAFVLRFRAEYGDAYTDVVTGICEAVEMIRLGLRVLASSCAAAPSGSDGTDFDHPLVMLQGMLLSFPYTCCQGLTSVHDRDGTGLGQSLQVALGPDGLDGVKTDRDKTGGPSGVQHMMLLQVPWFCFVATHISFPL